MKEIDFRKLSYYRTPSPIYKTQNEIRTILQKFGLQGIRFTEYKNIGIIEFILERENKEYTFRFKFTLPEKEIYRKQVYRALFHYLKNRFMAVEFGINSVEQEFLQELVLKLSNGSNSTVKEILGENINTLQYSKDLLLPFKSENENKKTEVKYNE